MKLLLDVGNSRFWSVSASSGKIRPAFAIFCVGLCTALHFIVASNAKAEITPPGKLVDTRLLEADNSMMCSVYRTKKDKEAFFLSRVDGQRLYKKAFWTLKSIKQRVAILNQNLDDLKGQHGKSVLRQVKRIRAEKKAILQARSLLQGCSSADPAEGGSVPVLFDHVKPIIQSQCMNCHGVLGWENSEQFFLNTARVTAGDLEASPFYTFLSNNPEGFAPAYMPKGVAPLSDVNILLLSRWIRNIQASPQATPTPGGAEGDGRALYQNFCASCHGSIDVSAKFGKTEAEIRAALGASGTPQMRFLKLTDEQIQKIALALGKVKPPLAGTLAIRALSSVTEGNAGETHALQFEISYKGKATDPFTVGYVTSNGSALAGSDYVFASGSVQFQGTDGETKLISVDVLGDNYEETDESLSVDIGGVSSGAVRIENSTANGMIVNDDIFVAGPAAPLSGQVRMAYGFNGDYRDALGLSDALPQGDTVISTDAKVGSGALELDAGADHLLLPGQNLQVIGNFTFGAWVYWQNNTANSMRIFDFGSSATSYIYFSPRDASNRCHFELRSATSATFTLLCSANTTLPANQWVFLATTYNTSTQEMKIFINGLEVATRAGVNVPLISIPLSDNKIGKSRVVGNADFVGRLDEITVWDAALDKGQIAEAMALSQTPAFNSGVTMWYGTQLVSNGGTIDVGSINVGETKDVSLFISNSGQAGLALLGTPDAQLAGKNSNEFSVQVQPWPWQQMIGAGSFTALLLHFAPSEPGDKVATLLLPNSDKKNGNFAAALVARANGAALPPPPAPADPNSDLDQGKYLYAVNCASCHGQLATSSKAGVTKDRLNTALNPTTGAPQMRGLVLSALEIDRIVLALNSAVPQTESSAMVSDSIVNVGTASYVASTLSQIFLPDDVTTFTADDNSIKDKITGGIQGTLSNNSVIAGRIQFFGGRCDRFDDKCQNEALVSSQRPTPNAIRTGLILKTCDDVLSIDKAVSNVLAKVQRTPSSVIDAQATKDLYSLFFPGRSMPTALADVISIYTKGLSQFTPIDHWRFQIHMMCTSTDWEVL